jgi:hypothetical protein
MSDRRAGKIFEVDWDEWCAICEKENEDPWDAYENGGGDMDFDLGGGNSYTVRLNGEPPREETAGE